ncbi:MAG: 50S ribosomal protein L9 [Rickettsiales bacterium]|jgi:large subunit ribosomal protein L9|nr:50S ribosomal protein L9 [Rickettsiales bacterium]
MKVILLERFQGLGNMGDTVDVKPGYARNFLFPQKKALKATVANTKIYDEMKKDLEISSKAQKEKADKAYEAVNGKSFTIVRQAGDTGRLFGSVTPKDIIALLKDMDIKVPAHDIYINNAIKEIGEYRVRVELHPEVIAEITIEVIKE